MRSHPPTLPPADEPESEGPTVVARTSHSHLRIQVAPERFADHLRTDLGWSVHPSSATSDGTVIHHLRCEARESPDIHAAVTDQITPARNPPPLGCTQHPQPPWAVYRSRGSWIRRTALPSATPWRSRPTTEQTQQLPSAAAAWACGSSATAQHRKTHKAPKRTIHELVRPSLPSR